MRNWSGTVLEKRRRGARGSADPIGPPVCDIWTHGILKQSPRLNDDLYLGSVYTIACT